MMDSGDRPHDGNPRQDPVFLRGLACAVPRHQFTQAEVAKRAHKFFGPLFDRSPELCDVFANAGIARRYSVAPMDWFDGSHSVAERNRIYLNEGSALFVEAAQHALADADVTAGEVDVIVSVSSTGIATPSLEARVADRLGFRSDVARVPVFGLGCAGGVSGLAIASRIARAAPRSIVLMVAVELCTLAFRADRADKADVIATALFGDGAAAVVLQATPHADRGVVVGAAAEHTWPGTLDIMGWSVDPMGFGVVLSRALPKFVQERLAEPARRFSRAHPLDSDPRFVCHPGGLKVLSAIEKSLSLDDGTLCAEREILRAFGNMSGPTALFVLQRVLANGLSGSAVLTALGPGFTASFVAIEAGDGRW